MIFYTQVDSPLGELLLISDGDSLCGLYMQPRERLEARCDKHLPLFKATQEQLRQYFAAERTEFELPLALRGTSFQRLVWQELCKIPYGKSTSYGEIARRLANPSAWRAVGLANGRNPLSIIVPCHRVVGQDGALTGYSGGLERKKFLLRLESLNGKNTID